MRSGDPYEVKDRESMRRNEGPRESAFAKCDCGQIPRTDFSPSWNHISGRDRFVNLVVKIARQLGALTASSTPLSV